MLEKPRRKRAGRKEVRTTIGTGDMPPESGAEYTYLTVPDSAELRSCLGVVLAGLITRAGVGVGGLDEAVQALEKAHAGGETSYRFALHDGRILAQVERRHPGGEGEDGDSAESGASDGSPETAGWLTLLELAS